MSVIKKETFIEDEKLQDYVSDYLENYFIGLTEEDKGILKVLFNMIYISGKSKRNYELQGERINKLRMNA